MPLARRESSSRLPLAGLAQIDPLRAARRQPALREATGGEVEFPGVVTADERTGVLIDDRPANGEMSGAGAGCRIEGRRALNVRSARSVGEAAGSANEVLRAFETGAEIGKVEAAGSGKRGVHPITVGGDVRSCIVDDAW